MDLINTNTSNTKASTYYLSIQGHGCELVMGAVSDRFSDYWTGRPTRDLSRYVFSEEAERSDIGNDVDMTGPWYETDNFAHANGPFTNGAQVTVLDDQGNKLLKANGLEEIRSVMNVVTKTDFRSKKVRGNTGIIKMGDHSKHELEFVIEADEPFDPSRLKIEQDMIDGLAIIDTVSYHDKVLEWKQWWNEGSGKSVLLLPRKSAA